jgi:steroid Delta-isomerase
MAATDEQIQHTIEQYVARVANGTTEEILELFADGATVEDPVGTPVRTTREELREFYGPLESMEQEAELLFTRIAGGQAAFNFRLATKAGDQTYTMAPVDVMTFDDEGKITSMRAFWGAADMSVS